MGDYERLWERLLEFLNTWTTATEVAPGRIRVVLEERPGPTRVVDILMTRDDWDDMVTIPWGEFHAAAQQVREALVGLQPDERFLVYCQYELVRSVTEDLPVDPDFEPLQQLARQHPDGFGKWVARDRDGNVRDQFGSPPE